MWYSYKQAVEIFWEEKALELFNKVWVSIEDTKPWRKAKLKIEKDYIKLNEYEHGKLLHKWLDDEWLDHTHIWNESWQSWTKNIVIMMAKKKASWVSSWFPDYLIYIPYIDWFITLAIELKKAPWKKWWWNGSKFKVKQAEWLNLLQEIPFTWVWLCQWSDQAIELVKNIKDTIKKKWLEEVLWLWKDREQINYLDLIKD